MENIIMPELITPAFADIMASRPEVLDQLMSCMGNNETVSENRSLTLDEKNLPKVLKLLFCNVNIRINNTCEEDIEVPYSCTKEKVEELRLLEKKLEDKRSSLKALRDEVDIMEKKVLVTETMVREYDKILKFVCKIPGCRKLSHKYKLNVREMQNSLKNEKWLLVEKTQFLEFVQYEVRQIEVEIIRFVEALLVQPD